jgi:deazaflavin-dependent oxidoreductase (nitroreductase family)
MPKTYTLSGGRKVYNRLQKALFALGLPTGDNCLLTVVGRRTGQPRSTPVAPLKDDGHRWLVSPYGEVAWVQNVRAAGRARLTCRGRSEDVRLREAQPVEAAPVLKTYFEKYRMLVAPYFDAKAGDPVDRFNAEAPTHPVFEILPG